MRQLTRLKEEGFGLNAEQEPGRFEALMEKLAV
jgi:hypothetical protein